MTFEEMQAILTGILESQAKFQENQAQAQAKIQESQAKFQENQDKFQENQDKIQESQAKFQEEQDKIQESQVAFRDNLALMRQDIANTQAIVNSNARAIEATANQQAYDREQMNQLKELASTTQRQLVEFIRFVGDYGETTNRRLSALEDRQ
jgi:chromosome segregation ATPase